MTKDVVLQVRMTKAARDAAEKLAQLDRRSVSDWARLLIEREVERQAANSAQTEKVPA